MTEQSLPTAARPWRSDVVLRDGGLVEIRVPTASDFAATRGCFDALSSRSIYNRFFSAHHPTDDELRRFGLGEHERTTSVLAFDDGQLIAVASYVVTVDPRAAEVSFAVADAHQHRGMGTLLLEHLAVLARSVGIERFTAMTLGDNAQMLNVFRASGFHTEWSFEDGIWDLSMDLGLEDPFLDAVGRREQEAEAESIRRILSPDVVAVVGASDAEGSIGHALFQNLRTGGFTGTLIPVNSRRSMVQGIAGVHTVDEIDGPVDLAVLAIPSGSVSAVLDQCGQAGVHAAVIITAGFAEGGEAGRDDQAELVAIARHHGMRLVGPNCIGIANTDPAVALDATFSPIRPIAGSVGFASQSGAMGIAALAECHDQLIGLSSFVSLGNKADVSGNDLLQFWETDRATKVAALYLESFGNPQKFARIARRFTRLKPLVVIKAGRSAPGRTAAASHTAALSSNEDLTNALFVEAGITRVETMAEFFDVIRMFVHQPLPKGNRVAVVGNSGGPGILAADACIAEGLDVPALSEETQANLREFLPAAAAVRNPVDLIASANADDYERAIEVVLADDGIDAAVVIYTDPMVSDGQTVAGAVARAASTSSKPVAGTFLATGVGSVLGTWERDGTGVPTYDFPEDASKALARAAELAAWRRRPSGTFDDPEGLDHDVVQARLSRLVEEAEDGSGWLTPAEVAWLLGAYGIDQVPTLTVESAEQAFDAVEGLGAVSVLKVISDTIVHKSDIGGVALNIESPTQGAEVYAAMKRRFGDEMQGAIVQPMAGDGVEVIIGVLQDQTFGPVLMFGMGGTEAEVWRDRAHALVPVSQQRAAALVTEPRGAALLQGYRGRDPVDLLALESLVGRMSCLAEHQPMVAELELNPVIATPHGCAVVDVRCRVAPALPRDHPEWRRLPSRPPTKGLQ